MYNDCEPELGNIPRESSLVLHPFAHSLQTQLTGTLYILMFVEVLGILSWPWFLHTNKQDCCFCLTLRQPLLFICLLMLAVAKKRDKKPQTYCTHD